MGCRRSLELTVSSVLWCLYIIVRTTCTESPERLIFTNEETSWNDAYSRCRYLNGTLITQEELEHYEIPQCAMTITTFWIGNIIALTPLISLKACVSATEGNLYMRRSHSVEQCAVLCSSFEGFEMQKDKCRCLQGDRQVHEEHINASLCSYYCKDGDKKQFCGGENVSNIYTFVDRDVNKENEGNNRTCAFTSCSTPQNPEYTMIFDKCSSQTNRNSIILCSTDGADSEPFKGNVSSWWDACQQCIVKHERYPIDTVSNDICCKGQPNDCNICNPPIAMLCQSLWTSTRKYEGSIIVQDWNMENFDIKKCGFSRMPSRKSFDMSQNCEESRHIVCKIYSATDEKFSCNATKKSPQATTNTKDPGTSLTQTSPVSPVDGRPSTVENQKQIGTEDTSPIGIIVGVILGLSVVIATAVIVVLFRRRAMCFSGQTKKTNNKGMAHRRETDHENGVIYQSTKDDEYDHINVRRKHAAETKPQPDIYHHVTNPMVKGSSENNYDEMKRKNQHLSENTYYSHAKSPNPLLTGVTGNEYDISGCVQPVNQTISSENAYDVCSKSGDTT